MKKRDCSSITAQPTDLNQPSLKRQKRDNENQLSMSKDIKQEINAKIDEYSMTLVFACFF